MKRNSGSKNSSSGLLSGIFCALGGIAVGVGAKLLYDELSDTKSQPVKSKEIIQGNSGANDNKERNQQMNQTTITCEDLRYEAFVCPITQEIMQDPVITPHGMSFDRKAIIDWLCKDQTCPLTKKPLKKEDLITNYALKSSIQEYLKTLPNSQIN